jgi:hypothetical protein
MPSAEVRRVVENSWSRIEQDRAYLRTLARRLAETETVIVRAARAYTISRGLLEKVDGAALNAPDVDQTNSMRTDPNARAAIAMSSGRRPPPRVETDHSVENEVN